MKTIYIINGPNLNLLGKRQPEVYGYETLQDIEENCKNIAAESGFQIAFYQSNSEAEIIDIIHDAREKAEGIIINPAAYTHTSVAILDALNCCDFPVFEVHISQIHKREEFRHKSYVSMRANGVLCGFGTDGYNMALNALIKVLNAK